MFFVRFVLYVDEIIRKLETMSEESSTECFKTPSLPASSSSSTTPHVEFKIPQTKKVVKPDAKINSSDESEIPAAADDVVIKKPQQEQPESSASEVKSEKPAVGEVVKPPINVEPVNYKPPVWSGSCSNATYDLDILKDGLIVGNIVLSTTTTLARKKEEKPKVNSSDSETNKPYYVFGRHGDLIVEHPSISRHHAVIQYRSIGDRHELGWYLVDLGSTHGTFLNKEKIPPFMHVRIRVGHMFKLGFSSRTYILNGPDEDREPELGISVTDVKQMAQKQKLVMMAKKKQRLDEHIPTTADDAPSKDDNNKDDEVGPEAGMKSQEVSSTIKDSGIDWGMSEDYGDEEEGKKNGDGEDGDEEGGESAMESIEELQKREQFYADDPRKALKNFFDRQNAADEMQFEYTERGTGSRHQWMCRIELPLESESGRSVVAEATVSGGKKEATVACALEACRLLDAAGILRTSSQEGRKRKSKEWAENDYYDSDEDTFLDRTGDVERKRAKRIRQVAAEMEATGEDSDKRHRGNVETHDSLREKLDQVNADIVRTQRQLDLIRAEAAQEISHPPAASSSSSKDTLDAYMAAMGSGTRDSQEAKMRQSRLRLKFIELKKSADRLEKLVKLTKPAALPPISAVKKLPTSNSNKQPILVGSMKGHRMMRKLVQQTPQLEPPAAEPGEAKGQTGSQVDVVEVEEEEEEEIRQGKEKEKVGEEKSVPSQVTSTTEVPGGVGEPPKSKPSPVKMYTVPLPAPEIIVSQEEEAKEEASSAEASSTEQQEEKQHQHHRQRKNRNKTTAGKDKEDKKFDEYDPSDINFAVWMPPDNQSGDGRTSLNEKFGY